MLLYLQYNFRKWQDHFELSMNLNNMSVIYNKALALLTLMVCAMSLVAQVPIDGVGNNVDNPLWGATNASQERLAPADFLDGVSVPRSGDEFNRPNTRNISNLISKQTDPIDNEMSLSDFVWAFGQFIDHDITLSPTGPEFAPIVVEEADEFFNVGDIILFSRSAYDPATGIDSPREYLNEVTSYIDASSVYGSDEERAAWLRTYVKGKMKVSEGNLLPWNTTTGELGDKIDSKAPHMEDDSRLLKKYFVAGDVRANENPVLAAIHTLFVREHNRLCDLIYDENPSLSDEEIYQEARLRVIGYIQNIVFNEWLPVMGIQLPKYSGYNENVNPNIFNEFATAAYRLGHTLINSTLLRMDDDGEQISRGNISLKDAFFNPQALNLAGGVEPYLKGMATQAQQEFDNKVVDDLRNFLFGHGGVGLDLAAINVERGRDRGLADYNSLRAAMGMPRVKAFADITDDAKNALLLKDIYKDVDAIDPWVGMLAERHLDESLFGELVSKILLRQFGNLRDGDRYYFENMDFLSAEEKEDIRSTTLRDIMMRNTNISIMQDEVFRAMPHEDIESGPELVDFPLAAAIYPNPISTVSTLKLNSDIETSVNITIFGMSGEVVSKLHKHVYKGINYIKIDQLEDSQAGYYNMLIESGNQFNIIKITKI